MEPTEAMRTFAMGEIKTVRTKWPTTVDEFYDGGKWIEYAIFLGVIGIIPIVIGLALYIYISIFFCCRQCGLCGGKKVQRPDGFDNYKKRELIWPSASLLLFFSLFVVLAIVGVLFSCLATYNIRALITQTGTTIKTVTETLDNIGNIGGVVSTELSNVVSDLAIFDKVAEVTSPLNQISILVNRSISTLTTFKQSSVPAMVTKVNTVQSDLQTLSQNSKLAPNVPSSSDIPDIQNQLTPSLDSGISSLTSAKQSVDSGIDSIANSLSDIKQTINDTFENNVGPMINSSLDGIQTPIQGIKAMIQPYLNNKTIADGVFYATLGENIRISLGIIFYSWGAIFYLLAFVGLLFKVPCCIQCSTCIAYFSAWFFLIFAAFQVPIYMLINQSCTAGPTLLKTVGDDLMTGINLGPIKLLNASYVVDNIASCRTNESFVSALLGDNVFESLGLNVSNYMDFDLSNLDISSATSAKTSILSANIGGIQADFSPELISARDKLDTATVQFNTFDGFGGFNSTVFNASIDALNAFAGVNTYTYDNYQTFSVSSYPAGQQAQAQSLYDAVDQQHQTYLNALSNITFYSNTLQHMRQNLNGLVADSATGGNVILSLNTTTGQIMDEIDTLTSNVEQLITDFPSLAVDSVTSSLSNVVNGVASKVVGCNFASVYITALDTNVCSGNSLGVQILITGICCFFSGVLMLLGIFVTVILHKRVKFQSMEKRVHPTMDPWRRERSTSNVH